MRNFSLCRGCFFSSVVKKPCTVSELFFSARGHYIASRGFIGLFYHYISCFGMVLMAVAWCCSSNQFHEKKISWKNDFHEKISQVLVSFSLFFISLQCNWQDKGLLCHLFDLCTSLVRLRLLIFQNSHLKN